MNTRFITKTTHAYLDYPVAIALMSLPFALSLGQSNRLAIWLSVATGAAAFLLTLLTDHKLGLIRVIPYSVHLGVDFLVGIAFLIAPLAFRFSGMDTWFYWANGAAVLAVVTMHRPESQTQCNVSTAAV